jgi:hypothetical protein
MRAPLFSLAACLLLGGAALADSGPPAAQGAGRAEASFRDFAKQWMSKLRGLEEHRPRVAAGPGSLVFTYRGYADEFRTELQPTGKAATPYVGLLHYTERVYTCPSLESKECTVAATLPVTEIFRLQAGRWTY